MGTHQYAPHLGQRNGTPTSGDILWTAIETLHNASSKAMFNAETALLKRVAADIGEFLPLGLPVIDLGPGTVQAFRSKVLPLLQTLRSERYIPVDESVAFLRDLSYAQETVGNCSIHPKTDDFFCNDRPYHEGSALVCSFGSTISNIENPMSDVLPEGALLKGLYHLATAAKGGALLISFDSNQDGKSIKDYYQLHALFQLNIFDRMAVEFSMKHFNPLAFDYEPVWIPASGQLAHTAVVTTDMAFEIDEHRIHLQKGQRLHMKNSYKFFPPFFEKACDTLQLEILRVWENDSTSKVYLLKIPTIMNKAHIVSGYMLSDRAVA